MIQLGINIIPVMPVREIIEIIKAAEELGFSYCLLADEGSTPDVYVTLGAAVNQTKKIRLGPVTNGYTRHPAVTATAIATLNELSQGRAFLVLVAGGSAVLDTLAIQRETPLTVVSESLNICRQIWAGNVTNFQGKKFTLANFHPEMGKQEIPIWIAGRGERILDFAGQNADGVLLMVKPDIGPALRIVDQYDNKPMRVYMDRIAYTPDMIEDSTRIFPYVIKDTPLRQLRGFLSDDEIQQIQLLQNSGGPEAVSKAITSDMIKRYKVAGTPSECHHTINNLINEHKLDLFVLNITTAGLESNIAMLRDVKSIVEGNI